jgi:hypothetical protein
LKSKVFDVTRHQSPRGRELERPYALISGAFAKAPGVMTLPWWVVGSRGAVAGIQSYEKRNTDSKFADPGHRVVDWPIAARLAGFMSSPAA